MGEDDETNSTHQSAAGSPPRSAEFMRTLEGIEPLIPPVGSIGAIAVAASDPDIVWVGTGEANIRNDVLPGAGHSVYYEQPATWTDAVLKFVESAHSRYDIGEKEA